MPLLAKGDVDALSTWMAVGMGGFLGATLRYLIARVAAERLGAAFPWGTLAANVIASALLGAAVAGMPTGIWQTLFAVGFCGSLSTFSAFSIETLALVRQARAGGALLNALLNFAGTVAAYGGGWWLAGGGLG